MAWRCIGDRWGRRTRRARGARRLALEGIDGLDGLDGLEGLALEGAMSLRARPCGLAR